MHNRILDFTVGSFVLLGFAALAMLTFKVGNFAGGSKQQGYNVTANFENIGGLTDKAPVRMAGVNIGRVTKIELDPETFSAKVSLLIDPQHSQLPADSSASILTSGLIGSNYVGLEAGGDFEYLQEGDQIEITQSALVLESLIGKFLFSNQDKSKDAQ